MITACRLTTDGADYGGLVPLVEATAQALGRVPHKLSGEAGFCTETNVEALEARGIKGYLMPGRARHGAAGSSRLMLADRHDLTLWAMGINGPTRPAVWPTRAGLSARLRRISSRALSETRGRALWRAGGD